MNAELPWYREPTRGQWASYFACWSGWVLDAFDFTIFLLVMPLIALEFDVPVAAVAGSVTLTLLVRLLGGGVAGWAADRWGRKLPLMISILWFAVFDGAIALAPSFTAVLVLRTLFGFGMGGEWAVGTTMAMENWPERSRGLASGFLQGSWAIGYLIAAVAFALVVPVWGWRALFALGVLPALLVLFIRKYVPESRVVKTDEPAPSSPWKSLVDHRSVMAFATVTMVLGFSVYYALSALYPTMLFQEMSLGHGAISMLVALFNVGMLCGAVVCGWVATRYGLRWAVATPALLAVFGIPLYVGWVPGMTALGVGAFLTGALGVGWAGVVPAFLTGAFPAEIRSLATGLVYHIGAFVAAFVPLATVGLATGMSIGLAGAIAVVSVISLAGLAAVLLLVPQPEPVSSTREEPLARVIESAA